MAFYAWYTVVLGMCDETVTKFCTNNPVLLFTTSFNIFTTVLQCSFTATNYVVNEGGAVDVGVELFGTPSVPIQKTIQCVAGTAGTA